MSPTTTAKDTLHVGIPIVLEGRSPSRPFSVVFEDDGETGYFYGLDLEKGDEPILDAMHIYDVAFVTDRDKPCLIEIAWSSDGLKSGLLINGKMHALFDFETRRGYCRSGCPRSSKTWTTFDHTWSDDAIGLLQ